MSFTNLGIAPFLAGLAVIAGLLFVLQRLRVRFREREVVTTLFWKQAVEETRARMLMKRFRHPWSYLLSLAIGGLIWLAVAQPDRGRHGGEEYVFLLDASAGMSRGDRFEEAKALLRREVDRLPADNRRVYFCGADARLILDRGEEASLLIPRLDGLAPEACPSSLEKELLALAAGQGGDGKLRLLVVGDAPVGENTVDLLPGGVTVERLQSVGAGRPKRASGIAALGLAEAASGVFDRVDIRVETSGPVENGISVTLGGRALAQAPVRDGESYFWRDVPARGGVLEVALTGRDAVSADNKARITLPDRRTVRVSVDENLDERFRTLVKADPALVLDAASAEVVIGGAADGSLPAIELVTGNGIGIIHDRDAGDADLAALRARFDGTGLDRVGLIAGPGTEAAAGFELVPRFAPGPQRRVQIGIELLGSDYDFMQTAAFPLFLSSAIRWLSGVDPVDPFAVAGERSVHRGQFALAGSDYAPPRAGSYLARSGKEHEFSLAALSSPTPDALPGVDRATTTARWPNLFAWCVLIALLLVVGEWWLFQKSRIP